MSDDRSLEKYRRGRIWWIMERETTDQYVITEEEQRRIDAIFRNLSDPLHTNPSHPSPDHSDAPGGSGG